MSPRRFRPPALYMKAPFLRELLDGMPDSVKVIDPQYRVVFANEVARKKLKADLNEVRGQFCHKAFYGFNNSCPFCVVKQVFHEGRLAVSSCTLSVNGSSRDFVMTVFPIRGEDGKVQYAVEMLKDVTAVSKGGVLPQKAGALTSKDRAFQSVFENLALWAEDDKPVLLQGEKGTGKRSFAQTLHQRSKRSSGPFRKFHCVTTESGECYDSLFGPEGAWESARKGTLFLEDICKLGEATQVHLAEKLARPEPDAPRVVGSTNEDLMSQVHQEVLRLDLYNRFQSRVLAFPPIRDRKQDLPVLAQHFIENCRAVTDSPAEKLGPEAVRQVLTYDWPGNIRELQARVERACLMASGPVIETLDLPVQAPGTGKLEDLLNGTEKAYLVDILSKSNGRLQETSRKAGLSLKTLQRKMKKFGLKPSDFRNLPK